jgi:hypothetical protein
MNFVKVLATLDLSMSCYSGVFFLLVNYILLPKKQFIIFKFFNSFSPKLEYILMVRP